MVNSLCLILHTSQYKIVVQGPVVLIVKSTYTPCKYSLHNREMINVIVSLQQFIAKIRFEHWIGKLGAVLGHSVLVTVYYVVPSFLQCIYNVIQCIISNDIVVLNNGNVFALSHIKSNIGVARYTEILLHKAIFYPLVKLNVIGNYPLSLNTVYLVINRELTTLSLIPRHTATVN